MIKAITYRILFWSMPILLIGKWIGVFSIGYITVFIGWFILFGWVIMSLTIGAIAYKIKK